ncbi:DUF488 family protein [Haloferula sp.]|uniref:DUF488 domain-containing protein n=1 Tax=Haloferula sp. TaxID=2497595 RepID=UPI003C75EF30
MIFQRQKHLLALLDALGGEMGGLDFQKLLFLYCREVETTPSYEFVPYRFGGFSFTSYADKRRLIERGLLADEERSWKLTQVGRAAAKVNPGTRLAMQRFAKAHADLRGDALVAETYRRHPYHATRSEMADRVLKGDRSALAAVAAARPASQGPGLCTIGYEGRTLEDYLNQLLVGGVTLLCDVRRNPLSRKYGFSKGTLSKSCAGVGIRYEHLPELGIASDQRRELNTQADYDALFEDYERDSLPKQTEALEIIRTWITKGERVALTCFEKHPHQCHRHCVAEALEHGGRQRLEAVHF